MARWKKRKESAAADGGASPDEAAPSTAREPSEDAGGQPGPDGEAGGADARDADDQPEGPGAQTEEPEGQADDQTPLVHTSQLDERLRRSTPVATAKDRRNRVLFDLLVVLGLLLVLAVVLAKLADVLPIPLDLSAAQQTLVLAVAMGIMTGASFLYNTIRWRALRRPKGSQILDKSRTDFLLTTVSIAALATVVLMVVVEILALFVFLGVITQVGQAGAAFAGNFILFQAIMLLVYLMALVAREAHPSSYVPSDKAQLVAKFLTPAAGVAVACGVLLAFGLPQRLGVLTTIHVHQAVYVVTLGVLLEFLAMRIRMRLPSLWSRFREAVDLSMRANEEMRQVLKKRAMRTYLISLLFVAASMAFAGAIATNNVALQGTRTTVALIVFYVGASLIMLGLIAVRVFQSRNIEKDGKLDEMGIEALLARKRRSPDEIFRMSVYAVGGFLAAISMVFAVLIGTGAFSDVQSIDIEVENRRGQVEIEQQDIEEGIHPKFATDAFLLGLLFAAGPLGFFYNQELRRIEAIDEKFPDFLRDIAESARAGMTLPRALVTAAQGTYGALTKEVRMMAAQVEWGVDFKEALDRFAQRAKTPLIDRTVSLIVEAQRAGGNVVDVLTAASDDAREIKQIVGERNEQMKLYKVVVYIAFFVFISVVLILSAQFIPAFKDAVGAASGQQVGGIQFKDFDPEDFNTLFFHAAVVQAIGGGLVGGVLTRGKPIAGFGSIAVMIVVAWISFRVLVGVM